MSRYCMADMAGLAVVYARMLVTRRVHVAMNRLPVELGALTWFSACRCDACGRHPELGTQLMFCEPCNFGKSVSHL
jgi:hypothetical protein